MTLPSTPGIASSRLVGLTGGGVNGFGGRLTAMSSERESRYWGTTL